MWIQNSPQSGPARPAREYWAIGREAGRLVDFQKDPLVSTEDLLRDSETIPVDGLPATYHFQLDGPMMKPATLKDYGLGLAVGVAGGAVLGVVGGLALQLMGGAFTILSAGMFGDTPAYGLVVPAALGAAAGAGSALGLGGRRKDYQHYGESLSGRLSAEYGPDGKKHLVFHTGREPEEKVDLEKYQSGAFEPNSVCWWMHASPNVPD